MPAEYGQPVLPEAYQELLTDRDLSVHEMLASKSLVRYTDSMCLSSVEFIDLDEDHAIRCVDIAPGEVADKSEAIIMPLPFGNGYSPSMYIRAITIQALLNEPKRLIMFPNNTHNERWQLLPDRDDDYTSQKEQLATVIERATVKLGVEKAHIVGYSQGATVGASVLAGLRGSFEVSSVFLGDPPNVQARTARQLKRDFQGEGFEGLKALNRAINDSAIPALSEAQFATSGLISTARQLAMFAWFGLGSRDKVNVRLHEDMTLPSFTTDIGRAIRSYELGYDTMPDRRNVVIARMAGSAICRNLLDPSFRDSGYLDVVDGYGHEGGDNVILHAILARLAIEGKDVELETED